MCRRAELCELNHKTFILINEFWWLHAIWGNTLKSVCWFLDQQKTMRNVIVYLSNALSFLVTTINHTSHYDPPWTVVPKSDPKVRQKRLGKLEGNPDTISLSLLLKKPFKYLERYRKQDSKWLKAGTWYWLLNPPTNMERRANEHGCGPAVEQIKKGSKDCRKK